MSGLFPNDNRSEFENDLLAEAARAGIPISGSFNIPNGQYGIPKVEIFPVNNNPILSSGNGNGILSGATPMPYKPPVTQKRRDQSVMSLAQAPNTEIGLNEMLIRMGSAGLGQVGNGGTAQMSAIGNAYANAMELNRTRGLDAYKSALKAAGKAKPTADTSNAYGSLIVNDSIARAMPNLTEDQGGFFENLFKGDLPSTGLFSYLSVIPGTDAKALANNLATIKANIGFDKLQAMRDASPTGGALGQVSERELGFLQSVFGSLDQSQTPEELQYNLRLLQFVYNDIVHGPGNHPYKQPVYGAGSPASTGSSMSEADAIVGIN